MKAPTIFGVAGRELGPYFRDSGTCFEWSVGPLRAFASSYAFNGKPDVWVGLWQIDDRRIELYCTLPQRIEAVAEELESWLRRHIAEIVGAMGLELRERAS
jgi:hypothetical protein